MKIKLAVYTAINGYDWQPSHYSTADLVHYKGGIGRLPNPPMDTVPYGGVFNDGNTIVFYRMHMAIKSDAKGRDSLYIVLGTLPKSEMSKVNFQCLFDMPEFAQPLKPAPMEVDYTGPKAAEAAMDYSKSFKGSLTGEKMLSQIGTLFAKMPNGGELSLRITITDDKPVAAAQFKAPPPPPQPPQLVLPPPPSMKPKPKQPKIISSEPDVIYCDRYIHSQEAPLWMTITLIILAFLIGCLVGYDAKYIIAFLKKDKPEQQTQTQLPPSGPVIQPPSGPVIQPVPQQTTAPKTDLRSRNNKESRAPKTSQKSPLPKDTAKNK